MIDVRYKIFVECDATRRDVCFSKTRVAFWRHIITSENSELDATRRDVCFGRYRLFHARSHERSSENKLHKVPLQYITLRLCNGFDEIVIWHQIQLFSSSWNSFIETWDIRNLFWCLHLFTISDPLFKRMIIYNISKWVRALGQSESR